MLRPARERDVVGTRMSRARMRAMHGASIEVPLERRSPVGSVYPARLQARNNGVIGIAARGYGRSYRDGRAGVPRGHETGNVSRAATSVPSVSFRLLSDYRRAIRAAARRTK
jgi:hypothetical protein